MESNRRRPRNSNHKSTSPERFLQSAAKNLPATSNEQQFYRLLKYVMTALGKDSSNNVAIVAMAAMFFGFAVLVLRPATPVINPPVMNVQVHPTTTVTTNQEQNQRIDPPLEPGS